MSALFLLDTNTISYATSGRSQIALERIVERPTGTIFASAISYAELRYGLRRRPEATKIAKATDALFGEIAIVPWTQSTADIYADLRTRMEQAGKSLSPLDMLIAAHALEAGPTLVSNDRAFRHVPDLEVEDWTTS